MVSSGEISSQRGEGIRGSSTDPLYQCSVCGKPFYQETSHVRHVQYCRRRAAVKPSAKRQRACQTCSKGKSKCDFQSPCSRCVAKGIPCVYDQRRPHVGSAAAGSASGAAPDAAAAGGSTDLVTSLVEPWAATDPHAQADADADLRAEIIPYSSWPAAEPSREDPFTPFTGLLDLPLGQDFIAPGLTLPFDPESFNLLYPSPASTTIGPDPLHIPSALSPKVAPTLGSFVLGEPNVTHLVHYNPPNQDTCLTYLTPPVSITAEDVRALVFSRRGVGTRSSSGLLSPGCRKLIISVVRAYPRMMLRPDTLPPFIHRTGCGLHFGSRIPGPAAAAVAAAEFAPLRPLAACVAISQVFVSRTPNTAAFLWRTIDAEHRRILEEMSGYSQGELLAALQAMIIYSVMRVIDHGQEYFVENRQMVQTMKTISSRIPFPSDTSSHRLAVEDGWEEFMFKETCRRIATTCFLMALVIGSEDCATLMSPQLVPLPCNKTLWEAPDARTWSREQDLARAERSRLEALHYDAGGPYWQPRLNSVADLAIATIGGGGCGGSEDAGGGRVGGSQVRAGLEVAGADAAMEEALDQWHAGVDGLGMLLASVIADI